MFLSVLCLFVLSVLIEFHSFSFITSSEESRIRKIKSLILLLPKLHLSPLFCPKSDSQGQQGTEFLFYSQLSLKLFTGINIMYSNRLSWSPWQCCWAGWDATIKTLVSVGHYLGRCSGCLGVQSLLSTTSSINWVCRGDLIK